MSTYTHTRMNLQKRTILCVDDSASSLFLCQQVLQSAGYEVFTAPNGCDALKILQCGSVDLAVIDNEMPDMNGVQLARKIRQLNPPIPVLMFSGSLPPSADVEIDGFVAKGEEVSALLDSVHALTCNTRWRGNASRRLVQNPAAVSSFA